MAVLLLAEHDNRTLALATAKALTAARAFGGDVDILVAGQNCRAVAEEMATTGMTRMPVVDRKTGLVCGIITAHDLLAGRKRAVVRESERNRAFQLDSLLR